MCQVAAQTGPATSAGRDRRHRHACARLHRPNTGVNTIAFKPTFSKYTLCKYFHRRQKPRSPPLHASKHATEQGPASSAHHFHQHPPISHPAACPSILSLCFFPSSSVPSVGPVQSESLVELRLPRLISKSCLFHLSKCLHSQLLYEEADKGCLLSTADRLPPPAQCGCWCVFIRLHGIYAKLCARDYISWVLSLFLRKKKHFFLRLITWGVFICMRIADNSMV